MPPVRSTHNPVGPAKRRPTYHPYDTIHMIGQSPQNVKKAALPNFVRRHLPLGRSPFPLSHLAAGITPRPQGVPPHQPLHCLQLSAYRLQRIRRSAASILRLCRGPSPRACILGITSIKTDSSYDTHICGEAAIPPYAPGAKHPQPGWRAQRCQPTTLMPHPSGWPEPQNIKKAALPNLCAATTIPPYCVKYFFDNIGISTDTPE